MSFQITVEGLTEKQAALGQFASGFQDAVDSGLRDGGTPIIYALENYPDEIPGSGYVRTFNYQHSITPIDMSIVSPGVFEAGGHMPYDIYLRGTSDGSYAGAYMHIGRWQPLFDIIQQYTPYVVEAIGRSIQWFADRLGL